MTDKEGAKESQWREGSTHTASVPGSTDLGLREMDEMEQKLNDEVVITEVSSVETIN